MKIIIDTLGGDNPVNSIEGTIMAMRERADLNFILVGDKAVSEPMINKAGLGSRVEYIQTTENISFNESPTAALKRSGTSLVMGLDLLKKDETCAALVSSGSTGALLAGAFLKIGRLEGVSRPTFCPWLPTKRDDVRVVLADAGANVDCKAINLVHFALMTDAYVRLSFGIEEPRMGLLNIGTEEHKGNELTFQTYKVLMELAEQGKINFLGNMEGRDALSGDYDIIIADGFIGNVLLKATEGAISLMGQKVSEVCHAGIKGKIGGLFLRKGFKNMKKTIHQDSTGGSTLLGSKKPVVKAHGNSSPRGFKNAIMAAAAAGSTELSDEIKRVIAENKELVEKMLTAETK